MLLLSRSPTFDRWLSRLISMALHRWTDLATRDYAQLLRLGGDHAVLELAVCEGDWVADRTLGEVDLRDEGVAVLGIERPGGRRATERHRARADDSRPARMEP